MTARGLDRRGLIAASGGIGLAAGAAGATLWHGATSTLTQPAGVVEGQNYSPHGSHQAGIVTPAPAVTQLFAFDLLPATGADGLRRLLRIWSQDIAALMAGEPAPGDVVPELAQAGCSLSITVGFGRRVFRLTGLTGKEPDGFIDVPAMGHDRLQPRWCGGDVVVLIAADDPTSVAFARRRLVVDAETFAKPRWVQTGSWRGKDAEGRAITGRNLFGQVDGTGNPPAAEHDRVVWLHDAPWVGGTTLVVRRIQMNLDVWDTLTRERQERVIGRTLANGAPLGGVHETDPLDLQATADGHLVVAANAHARLSHRSVNHDRQILRRGLNYTHEEAVDGVLTASAGLIFLSFQASIADQFVPIQQRLDAGDALNEWTTAIGSAVFAVPGGFGPDSWLAASLF